MHENKLLKYSDKQKIMDLQEVLGLPEIGTVDQNTINAVVIQIKESGFDKSKYYLNKVEEEKPVDPQKFLIKTAMKTILKERYMDDLEKISKFMMDCKKEKVKQQGIEIIEMNYDPEMYGSEEYRKVFEKGGTVQMFQQGSELIKQVLTTEPWAIDLTIRELKEYAESKTDDKRLQRLIKSDRLFDGVSDDTIVKVSNDGFELQGTDEQLGVKDTSFLNLGRAFAKGDRTFSKLLGSYLKEDEVQQRIKAIKESEKPEKKNTVDDNNIPEKKNDKSEKSDISEEDIETKEDIETEKDDDEESTPKKEKSSSKPNLYKRPEEISTDVALEDFQKWALSQGHNIGSSKVDGKFGPSTKATWDNYGKDWIEKQKEKLRNLETRDNPKTQSASSLTTEDYEADMENYQRNLSRKNSNKGKKNSNKEVEITSKESQLKEVNSKIEELNKEYDTLVSFTPSQVKKLSEEDYKKYLDRLDKLRYQETQFEIERQKLQREIKRLEHQAKIEKLQQETQAKQKAKSKQDSSKVAGLKMILSEEKGKKKKGGTFFSRFRKGGEFKKRPKTLFSKFKKGGNYIDEQKKPQLQLTKGYSPSDMLDDEEILKNFIKEETDAIERKRAIIVYLRKYPQVTEEYIHSIIDKIDGELINKPDYNRTPTTKAKEVYEGSTGKTSIMRYGKGGDFKRYQLAGIFNPILGNNSALTNLNLTPRPLSSFNENFSKERPFKNIIDKTLPKLNNTSYSDPNYQSIFSKQSTKKKLNEIGNFQPMKLDTTLNADKYEKFNPRSSDLLSRDMDLLNSGEPNASSTSNIDTDDLIVQKSKSNPNNNEDGNYGGTKPFSKTAQTTAKALNSVANMPNKVNIKQNSPTYENMYVPSLNTKDIRNRFRETAAGAANRMNTSNPYINAAQAISISNKSQDIEAQTRDSQLDNLDTQKANQLTAINQGKQLNNRYKENATNIRNKSAILDGEAEATRRSLISDIGGKAGNLLVDYAAEDRNNKILNEIQQLVMTEGTSESTSPAGIEYKEAMNEYDSLTKDSTEEEIKNAQIRLMQANKNLMSLIRTGA